MYPCFLQRRYGWVYEPREGVKELLRSLVDPNAGVFVTLWSENSLGVANEVMDKLMQEIGGPPAHTAPVSYTDGRDCFAVMSTIAPFSRVIPPLSLIDPAARY